MAESAIMRLEIMLPEIVGFDERGIFSKDELKTIMAARRAFEYAIASRSAKLDDYMSYIGHEIKTEIDRRERYAKLGIKRETARDFTIVKRIHSLFDRCLSKYSSDVGVWKKYIEFCVSSGSSSALTRTLMRAIKRHPRAAQFRILAADRELQMGNLIGARKLLMLAVRAKTDDRCLVWEQLFKLECVSLFRKATAADDSNVVSLNTNAAMVVVRHGIKDLAALDTSERFVQFSLEAFEALELSLMGYKAPDGMAELGDLLRKQSF